MENPSEFVYNKIKTNENGGFFMKKRILTLAMAVALSFSTITFTQEARAEAQTIVGTDKQDINNLLEMSNVSYVVQLYAENILHFCDTIEILLYSPASTKEEQQNRIDSTYAQLTELRQRIANYQSNIDSLLENHPYLDGDIQIAKGSMDALLKTCDILLNVLSSLSEYNKNNSQELYKKCNDAILQIHNIMIDYYNSCKDTFWGYFDTALELSRQ